MAKGNRKLSDSRVVNALRPDPAGGDITVFDDRIAGLGVRVKPSGKKSWVLKYRNKHGEQRRYTIGDAGKGGMAPGDARELAGALKVDISKGKDPSAERRTERNAQTVAELCDQYLESREAMVAAGTFKASTLAMDKSRIERHVKPLIGKKHVKALTARDIETFLRDVRAGKSAPAKPDGQGAKRKRGGVTEGGAGVAARTYSMLRTILQRAVTDGAIEKNPATSLEKAARPKDAPMKRLPFVAETVSALGKAMREAEAEGENKAGLQAIRFLLLTGFRRMEGLTLQWEIVDRAGRCVRFKDTKTGAQFRPLGRAALDLLGQLQPKAPAKPKGPVFPGPGKGGHFVGLPKVWARIAKRAGIEGVSLHGLRHWFASAATELGYSDLIVGALLGHAKKGITGRYATAPDPALLVAADAVSRKLAEALDGPSEAKVVNLAQYG